MDYLGALLSAIIEKSVAYFLDNGLPFAALRDGQAIVHHTNRMSNEVEPHQSDPATLVG